MGFKKSWDATDVLSQIGSLARECSSPYNDGYTGWYCKQDLYQIKQLVDQALSKSPHFGELEQEWLHTQEKKHIIKILKS